MELLRSLKKIFHSEGAKITSLNSISVIIKIITGAITSKVLALFIGPSGMALVGNFRNFTGIIDSLTSLGFQNGIVKYVAENKNDDSSLQRLIATLLVIVILVSLISGVTLFMFADYWNSLIFTKNYYFDLVFKALAFLIPLNVFGGYLLAIVNGFNKFKEVIYINIFANIIGLSITILLVYYFKILGAILSVILTTTVLFFIALNYLPKSILNLKMIKAKYDSSILKQLGHYLLMMLISGVLSQLLQIYIRNLIIQKAGIDQAGFWEAINRISSNYMLFISTLLGVYYYPKLINSSSSKETGDIIKNYYKNIIPLFFLGSILVYFSRDIIIQILFTEQFKPISQLFFWQLLGDFFKTFSWILGFQFLARKMSKEYLFFEFISFGILFLASIYFINRFEVKGAIIAFAISYIVYSFVLSLFFRKILFQK